MNLNKLEGRLREYNFTYGTISKNLKLSTGSIRDRLNGKRVFTQPEISKLKKLLNLSNDEVAEIFLD